MAKCGDCGKIFSNKKDLRLHKKKIHGGYFTSSKEEREKPAEESLASSEGIITMNKEEAEKELKEYREIVKTRGEDYLKQIKESLYHLSQGRSILDMNIVMKVGGINEEGEPKLAIARSDWNRVRFRKQQVGAGRFFRDDNSGLKMNVSIPENTFPKWNEKEKADRFEEKIIRKTISTKVPIVPAQFLPKGKLENYYILWEVDKWNEEPPKDPILLKRIEENTFVVLGAWDLTPLEQSIIRGRR